MRIAPLDDETDVDRDPLEPLNPLAESLVSVLRELVEVKRDRDAFCEIVAAAIHLLHDRLIETRALRAQNDRLLNELRAARQSRRVAA